MPATTRSANKQAKLEDVGAGTAAGRKSKSLKPATQPKKREAAGDGNKVDGNKRAKKSPEASKQTEDRVSTITAISKGRSIGKIDKTDPGEAKKKKAEREKRAEKEDLDELEVMSFKLNLDKDGQAVVGGKPKKSNEGALKKKYGETQYMKVKQTFEEALRPWKGKEDELQRHAFQMYENFRPSIPPGQSGWGRKGQLNLEAVKTAISNGP